MTVEQPLVWFDLETTGLDDAAYILELGCRITDGNLALVDEKKFLVENNLSVSKLQSKCDQIVLDMHHNNGLWDDLIEATRTSTLWRPLTIESAILVFLRDHGVEVQTAPMAGSSIHFDRRLIRRDMASLDTYCSYRNIDVSTIKELCRRWAPTVYESRPGKDESQKKHRVLDDIEGSIEELWHYRTYFLHEELGIFGG